MVRIGQLFFMSLGGREPPVRYSRARTMPVPRKPIKMAAAHNSNNSDLSQDDEQC